MVTVAVYVLYRKGASPLVGHDRRDWPWPQKSTSKHRNNRKIPHPALGMGRNFLWSLCSSLHLIPHLRKPSSKELFDGMYPLNIYLSMASPREADTPGCWFKLQAVTRVGPVNFTIGEITFLCFLYKMEFSFTPFLIISLTSRKK